MRPIGANVAGAIALSAVISLSTWQGGSAGSGQTSGVSIIDREPAAAVVAYGADPQMDMAVSAPVLSARPPASATPPGDLAGPPSAVVQPGPPDAQISRSSVDSTSLDGALDGDYVMPGPGGSTYEVMNHDGSEDLYVVSGYPDLGQYKFRSQGTIAFGIFLPFRGPVDASGHPTSPNSYAGQTIDITIHAWDVNEFCTWSPFYQGCEVDELYVNGRKIEGQKLHGSGEAWSDTTFSIDSSYLRFASSFGASDGENSFELQIDTLQTGVWAVKVDRATVHLSSREASRPIVLLHGLGASSDTSGKICGDPDGNWAHGNEMAYLKCAILQAADEPDPNSPSVGWAHGRLSPSQIPDVIVPEYGGGPLDQNLDGLDQDLALAWPFIEQALEYEKHTFGWTKVNIIGHSMGGVLARAVASQHPESVKTVVTIGSPDDGVSAADAYCWPTTLGVLNMLGHCSPGAIRDIQTGVMKDTINKQYPDDPQVTYYALAGTNGTSTCIFINPAGDDSDSCVTIESQQFLVKGNPDNHGTGTEIGGSGYEFWATHAQETNTWESVAAHSDHWQQAMLCLVMGPPAPCPDGTQVSAASAKVSASPTSAVKMEYSSIVDGSVAANSSIRVPLSFEGAATASVAVYWSATGASASLGSTTLQTDPAAAIPYSSASLASPSDGDLVLVNPTSGSVGYRVVVSIPTERRLLLSVESPVVAHGSPLAVHVQIDGSTTGEVPTLSLFESDGQVVPVALSSVGTGQWIGYVSPNSLGVAQLSASVIGPRARYASATITVTAGTTAVSGVAQATQDVNGDGLYDALKLTTTVTVGQAGTYVVSGRVLDQSGTSVTVTGGEHALSAGSNQVEFSYPGSQIYETGVDAPSHLVVTVSHVTQEGTTLEVVDAPAGTAFSLNYRQFQHLRVAIEAPSVSERPVDADANGFYESIRVSANVRVDTAGNYVVQARLTSTDGVQVTRILTHVDLLAGVNAVSIDIDGAAIWKLNVDGPYQVEDLSVESGDGALGQNIAHPLTTRAYLASQFSGVPVSQVRAIDTSVTNTSFFQVQVDSNAPYYEFWQRVKPAGSADFGDWQKVGMTTSDQPWGVNLTWGDGTYEFYSRAVDPRSGVREEPPATADAHVVFDATPPAASIGTLTAYTSSPALTVPINVTDLNGSGVASVAIYARYRSSLAGSWGNWYYAASGTGSETSLNVTLSQGEGYYELGIQASDKANNWQFLPTSGSPIFYSATAAPSSRALPIGGYTNQAAISVPYEAQFVSGSGSVDLWVHFQAYDSTSFDPWEKVATVESPNLLTVPLNKGTDGRYEFVTQARDSVTGGVESLRTTADTYVVVDTKLPVSSMTHNLPGPLQTQSVYLEANSSDDGSGLAEIRFYYRYKHLETDQFGEWKLLASTTQPYAGDNTIDCPVPLHGLSYCRVLDFIPSEGEGYYEVSSVAVDKAGNVEAKEPAKSAFRLDNTAPTVTVTSPVATKSTWASISYTVTDPSGVGSAELYERYTAIGASPSADDWYDVRRLSSSPTTVQLNQGEGTYDFYVQACDAVYNCMTGDWVVQASITRDATAPTASLTSLPAHITSASQTVAYSTADNSGGSGVQTLQIQRQFKGTGSWLPLATITAPPSSGSASVTLADGYGSYQFRAVATDYAGNVTTSALTSATSLDPPAPATQAGPIAGAVNSKTLLVPYTVTSGTPTSVSLYQRFTSSGATPGGSYTKLNLTATNNVFTVTLASDGLYEFYTLGTASGVTESPPGPADTSTVLDTVLPTSQALTLVSPRTTNSVTISYTANDETNGSGLKSVDLYQRYTTPGSNPTGNYTKLSVTPVNGVFTVTLGGDGLYEFYTLATDQATNAETPPLTPDASTVLDTTGPITSASALPPGVKTTAQSVGFTANDAGGNGVASVQLYMQFTAPGSTPGSPALVGTSTSASGTFNVTLNSGPGRYEFYTIGVDGLGNREAVPASPDAFTVLDTTAPASHANAVSGQITSPSLSVPYTASEELGGSGIKSVVLYVSYEASGSSTWSPPALIGSQQTGTTGSFSITLTQGNGSYRLYTIATDNAGNAETKATTTAEASTVLAVPDTIAPTSSITQLPSTSSASSISIPYTASDTGGSGLKTVEFWYRVRASDGATVGAWTSGGSSVNASGNFTLTVGSTPGIYEVLTVAVDNSLNRESGIASPPAAATLPKTYVRAVAWNGSTKVNTDTGTALQDNASFAVGSDGTVYAVWEDSRNGNTDIYFSSRNPSTGAWAAETKLNTDTGTAGQRTPSITIDGSGNLYVVWADDRNGSTNTDIYFAKRTGTQWSANIKVSDDTTSKIQNAPRISVNSSGVAIADWVDARTSPVSIYSARLAAGSTTWSTNYKVTSNTTAAKAAPDVAVASDGSAWATWQDNQTGGGDIYVASLAAGGTSWSTNTKVSDNSGSSSVDKSPRIGLTSANLPVVAYLDGRSTNAAVRVTNRTSGGSWNATVQVSDSSAKASGGLALAVKADGGVIVAWDDTRSTSAIWGAQCEAGSGSSAPTRCGPAEKWSDQTGASYRPTLIATTSKIYLGWRDDTAGGGDIRNRLRNPS